MADSTTAKPSPTIDFVAGTVAGMAGLTVGYPFDTVKVRFQSPETANRYPSTLSAFTTIIREERVRGLFKGITSPMASCAFLNGLVFGVYGLFMRFQLRNDSDQPTLGQITLAGAGTGIVASIITCPTELIKIRQQGMLSATGLPSTRQVAMAIYRKHGIRGLYRGLVPTALRDCGYGAYFATYEATCRFLRPPPQPRSALSTTDPHAHRVDHSSLVDEVEEEMAQLSWGSLMLAGGLAGIMGWVPTFALDVVKTRVQGTEWYPLNARSVQQAGGSSSPTALVIARAHGHAHSAEPVFRHVGASSPAIAWSTVNTVRGVSSFANQVEAHPYRTTLSTFKYSYQTGGLRSFFCGLTPTLIRAVPTNMATFGVFELVVHLFRQGMI